jgi:hypothetical protein
VILLIAVAAGLLITILRSRITGRPLKPIELKFAWLVFVAVIPQILIFQIPAIGRLIPDGVVTVILVSSQGLLLGFAAANIKQPGFWLLALGSLANFLVIIFNGGWMPISPGIVHRILPDLPSDFPLVGRRLGLSKDWIYADHDIRLPWLSDRFTLPDWIPYRVAFSFGDILIALGAIWLLWSLSDPENKEKK